MPNVSDQEALAFCRRYPPMPPLLSFHYDMLCRQKTEDRLRRLSVPKKAAKLIVAAIPFRHLLKVTPQEIGAAWKAQVDAREE